MWKMVVDGVELTRGSVAAAGSHACEDLLR